MFVDFLRRHFGLQPRIIAPEDLRLVPDARDPLGYKLCCLAPQPAGPHDESSVRDDLMSVDGEVVEEIHQVGLELHQRELLAIPKDVLRHVSLRCFNDLRTILLVHDKRILGIVRQELDSLVRRSVLDRAQADTLRNGIVDTFLPGSADVLGLTQRSEACPDLRSDYVLKPIRGGKGAGIIFGDEVSPAVWLSHLEQLRYADLAPGRQAYVVQRQVKQRLYDMIVGASGKHVRYPLVGTYHVVHGELLGLGTWRCSSGRICAVSNGGSWICSVIAADGPRQHLVSSCT